MLGAIIGDMVGSIYEFWPIKSKDFDIYNQKMRMTDDSLLTIEVAKTIMDNYPIDYSKQGLAKIKNELIDNFHMCVANNPGAGWGGRFYQWARFKEREPYYSFGNGSAMRISPVGWIAYSEEEVKLLSKAVSEITHNHPEGIKGAEAVALCIYLSLHGSSKEEIRQRMINEYYPEIECFDFNELVKNYQFFEICQKSVPQAIYCFLISNSLEDAIRNCVAIGGDCDTTGAMAGAIAEAYYQKEKMSEFEEKYLKMLINSQIGDIIAQFHRKIGSKKHIV